MVVEKKSEIETTTKIDIRKSNKETKRKQKKRDQNTIVVIFNFFFLLSLLPSYTKKF